MFASTIASVAFLALSTGLHAQDVNQGFRLEQLGSAAIVAGEGPNRAYDFKGHSDSKLKYEWVMVIDSSLGIVFDKAAGVRAEGPAANPGVRADFDVRAVADIAAYEIVILTFDVWRKHTGTVVYGRLRDMKPGDRKGVKQSWGGYSNREVSLQLTSLSFVSKVRYKDGRIVIADTAPVLRAAELLKFSITAQDLDPTEKATESDNPADESDA